MTENSQHSSAVQEDERRQHSRLDRTSTIRYQPLQHLASQGEMKAAELCDFSGGGIRFLTDEPLPKNEQLVIELHFTGWSEKDDDWIRTGNDNDVGNLNAIGAVMWCSKSKEATGRYEIGLRFTGRLR
nr:PilZ domain-containing protein [Desulfobulbaceae bacterium]